jgi:hypothetical protein
VLAALAGGTRPLGADRVGAAIALHHAIGAAPDGVNWPAVADLYTWQHAARLTANAAQRTQMLRRAEGEQRG